MILISLLIFIQVWLLIVAVFTVMSIAVFLLQSTTVFRNQRPGQPSNQSLELYGHNPKVLGIATTIVSPEMAFVEILSNTVLVFDLVLRFSISHRKKKFFRKPYNFLELLTEMVIYIFIALEFLSPSPESIGESATYELSTLLQILYSLRVLRIFRVLDSCSEMKMLKLSLLKSKTEFCLFVTVLISFAFVFGSWIYWVEFLNTETFPNIFVGIWWAIVTMTTVGYGDFAPKSTAGYFVGVLTCIFGLILLSMPVATIASNFSKIYDCYNFRKTHLKAKRSKEFKPRCYQENETSIL